MLDDALRRNHLAYTKTLKQLLPKLEEYTPLNRHEREKAIKRDATTIVRPLPLSSGAKAGVVEDIHGQLASHLELLKGDAQEKTSLPTACTLDRPQVAWTQALEDFRLSLTEQEETERRTRLLAQHNAGRPRPVLFLKNRKTDGYLVLYNPEKAVYALWLNLHPENSRFAERIAVRNMVNIRTGEVVSFASKTGAVFPVVFGKDYQFTEFLSKARPQSAKLLRTQDGAYEVHVTFLFEAERIDPLTVLGVDRGIYNLASLCVMDRDGHVIARENVDGRRLRHVQRTHERRQREAQQKSRHYRSASRRAMADEAVHYAANRIAALAQEHRSQVVLENLSMLTRRSGKRGRSNFNRVLNRSQYAKLERVLIYKLAVLGLPKPKTVAAAGTSQTCPRCGHWSSDNRKKTPLLDGSFAMERFACVACGHEDDADLNAARVIGLKKIWREALPASLRTQQAKEVAPEHSFCQFLRCCATRRGEWP
jgi:IS605 OrfB family transposase